MLTPLLTQLVCLFFFNDTATTEIYTLSLHDALPIFFGLICCLGLRGRLGCRCCGSFRRFGLRRRSEEHTSELQSRLHLVCRLLLEKKKKNITPAVQSQQYVTAITKRTTDVTPRAVSM